jgi:hypothetical protein
MVEEIKRLAIPASQLSTWSNRGADITAQNTHQSIRAALAGSSQLKHIEVDTFLQGSYRNATNIRADSDVDLVANLPSVFQYSIADLPQDQQALFRAQHSDATYEWKEFRSDVLAALRDYYGPGRVQEGNKAIKVARASNRLAADVVVTIPYRLYKSYRGPNAETYIEGIWFLDRQIGREIVNYPQQHYDNGAAKNAKARTGEQFKPAVRMFKNARGCLVERGVISATLAPSYFLQCLLFNVPDEMYVGSLQQVYAKVINCLQEAPLDAFICQNGVVPLFGAAPEQWNKSSAKSLISGLIRLWNTW